MKTAIAAAEPPDRQPTTVFDNGGAFPAAYTLLVNNTGEAITVTSAPTWSATLTVFRTRGGR